MTTEFGRCISRFGEENVKPVEGAEKMTGLLTRIAIELGK